MLKIFENFDFSRVGQVQSLLEAHGIPTFLKNQYTSSVMGEVPFVEVCPQLYLLDEGDLQQAKRLLGANFSSASVSADWVCQACGTRLEGQFGACWNCGAVPLAG